MLVFTSEKTHQICRGKKARRMAVDLGFFGEQGTRVIYLMDFYPDRFEE